MHLVPQRLWTSLGLLSSRVGRCPNWDTCLHAGDTPRADVHPSTGTVVVQDQAPEALGPPAWGGWRERAVTLPAAGSEQMSITKRYHELGSSGASATETASSCKAKTQTTDRSVSLCEPTPFDSPQPKTTPLTARQAYSPPPRKYHPSLKRKKCQRFF